MDETKLEELGYTVDSIKKIGNNWLIKIHGRQPVYYLRTNRNGKLRAFHSKKDKLDTTIAGFYDFEIDSDGSISGRTHQCFKVDEQVAA